MKELVRERMCLCNWPLSLSFTQTYKLPVWRRETRSEHESTKSPFKQKDKNGLLCSIHLGKQPKKENKQQQKKHCADLYITDTNHHTSVTLSHSYTFKNIHF